MATFKVGQRVRIIFVYTLPHCLGKEATIVARHGDIFFLDVDNVGTRRSSGSPCWVYEHQLAQLTDPKADEFIESLKKLGREPNVAPVDAKVKA
jgi:hypothetical protein